MAIKKQKRTTHRVELVWYDDDEVTPKDPLATGWMPRHLAQVSPGADVVLVEALDIDGRADAQDGKGFNARMLRYARLGTVGINGSRKAVGKWMSHMDPTVVTLLGVAVSHLTGGLKLEDQRDYMTIHTPDEVSAGPKDVDEPSDDDKEDG